MNFISLIDKNKLFFCWLYYDVTNCVCVTHNEVNWEFEVAVFNEYYSCCIHSTIWNIVHNWSKILNFLSSKIFKILNFTQWSLLVSAIRTEMESANKHWINLLVFLFELSLQRLFLFGRKTDLNSNWLQ